MKIYSNDRGFTINEFLVTVAIVGILAATLLLGMKASRNKQNDARIQGEVAEMKQVIVSGIMEGVYPDLMGDFTHVMTLNPLSPNFPNLSILGNDIGERLPDPVTDLIAYLPENRDQFVIYASAISGSPSDFGIYAKTSTGYFCADSYGNSVSNSSGGALPASFGAISSPGTALCQ